MTYKELSALYYADASSDRESHRLAELERRKNAETSIRLGVNTPQGEFFIATPFDLQTLSESILSNEKAQLDLMNSLPGVAKAALVRGLVLDEVVGTNAIENVNSTRKQIQEALEAGQTETQGYRRFKELAILYYGLSEPHVTLPQNPKDIRSIYDAVMEGELNEETQPDGKLFRAHGVDVVAGGVKVVHSGVQTEEEIEHNLKTMFTLLSDESVPKLLSAIVSHLIFEYTHPFYDGNGRCGRYLLALFLKEILSVPTVLSLSRTISENKGTYYEAFSSAEKKLNGAEATFFAIKMLQLVGMAQSDTALRIRTALKQWQEVERTSNRLFESLSIAPAKRTILAVLAQYDLFGSVRTLTLNDLAEHVGLGKQMVRKHAQALEELGYLEKVSLRPLRFALAPQAEEQMGLSAQPR